MCCSLGRLLQLWLPLHHRFPDPISWVDPSHTDICYGHGTCFDQWNIRRHDTSRGFPGGSVVKKKKKHLSMQETQETWVQSLNQEDPLEKEMATHSSILAWRIPWTEEPGRQQSMGSKRVWVCTHNSAHDTSRELKVLEYWACPFLLPEDDMWGSLS